jgi:hypothetical protein
MLTAFLLTMPYFTLCQFFVVLSQQPNRSTDLHERREATFHRDIPIFTQLIKSLAKSLYSTFLQLEESDEKVSMNCLRKIDCNTLINC